MSGTVSAANSLIEGGVAGSPDNYTILVTPLTNGNYVVDWKGWNGNRGAVTWCDGTKPTTGTVSADNSLVGENFGDYVGDTVNDSDNIVALPDGNYLVSSYHWNGEDGAITWGDGTKGVQGTVSADNSLVGSNPDDHVGGGWGGITILANGNYVVDDWVWGNSKGAVTWGNAATGVKGVVSADNSLVGSVVLTDQVGRWGVVPLTNGNYVVASPGLGAVTWGSGTAAVQGVISTANSLVGAAQAYGQLGPVVTALTNGNYVVDSAGYVPPGEAVRGRRCGGRDLVRRDEVNHRRDLPRE